MKRRILTRPPVLAFLAVTTFISGCVIAQEPWPNLNDAEGHLQAALDSLHRALLQ